MSWWWKHNIKTIPSVRPDDRKFIEELTGRVPLLLRPLLRAKERQFIDCRDQYLASEELVHVRSSVLSFLSKKQETWTPNTEKSCVYIESAGAKLPHFSEQILQARRRVHSRSLSLSPG